MVDVSDAAACRKVTLGTKSDDVGEGVEHGVVSGVGFLVPSCRVDGVADVGCGIDAVDELDLSSLTLEEKEELGLNKKEGGGGGVGEVKVDFGPREVDDRTRERLVAIEDFYVSLFSFLVFEAFANLFAATERGPPAPSVTRHCAFEGHCGYC